MSAIAHGGDHREQVRGKKQLQAEGSTPTMDRWNLGQGGSVSSSSSSPFPPPPFTSSVSGKLSVPRFRKHRKHTGTSGARCGLEKGYSLSREQSLANTEFTKSEGIDTILGAGTSSDTYAKTAETGMPKGGSVFSFGVDNVYSDTGAFVFQGSAIKDEKLLHNSSLGFDNNFFYKVDAKKVVNEQNGQLDSGFFKHRVGEKRNTHSKKKSTFALSDGLLRGQTERTRKIDQENFSNVGGEKANLGAFLSGCYTETKANLDNVSSMTSDEGLVFSLSKLPEEVRKLKIEEPKMGNEGLVFSLSKLPEEVRKLKIEESREGEEGSVFSLSNLPEEVSKLKIEASKEDEDLSKDPGVFIFGSGINKSNGSYKSSSFGAFDSLFAKLPENMENLKLKQAEFAQTSTSSGEGVFCKISGQLRNKNLQTLGSEGHESDNIGAFVFGSEAQEKDSSSKSSSHSFDEASISKLPDEICKMKLSSSGNEDDCQNSTPDNTTETTCSQSPISNFPSSGADFCFTTIHSGSETPRMEFRSQKLDASMINKKNLFTVSHKNTTSSMKKEDPRGLRSKVKRGKSRQSTPLHSDTPKQVTHEDKGLEQDSNGGYSPMDFSPYQETLVSNQCSRDASVESDESIYFDSTSSSNYAPKSVSSNANVAVEHFGGIERFPENKSANCCSKFPSTIHFNSEYSGVNVIPGLRKENSETKDETLGPGTLDKTSMESESFSYSSIKNTTYGGRSGFIFTSKLEEPVQSNFYSTTKSSVQGPSSASRRIFRRKSRVNGGQDSQPVSSVSPSNLFIFPNVQVPVDSNQHPQGCDDVERARRVNGAKTIEKSATTLPNVKAEEVCEKWRIRGNQAYADGNLLKAEDYYSHGVDSFPLKEVSKGCNRALMLCFSNRAATRMSLGRLREALNDCKMAITIDPSFLRAQLRAGNILLSLGEPADALQYFEKVLQIGKEAKYDQKILLEAVYGLEKAQKLIDLMDQSSILLKKKTPEDATKSLEILSEALSFSSCSEISLEMKAEALLMLRNFDEAIQICEQTLELAEKNAVTDSDCQLKDDDHSKSLVKSDPRLWRWRILAKSYFYLGKLEEANDLLQKHENVIPVIDKYWNKCQESSTSYPFTVRELLRLKTAGNEAFQAGKHLEAVEFYTAALALSTESRPFTAVCFCNRAAAYQALGQITDAIADCSLAIALDSSYRKAISRRATLHEMIRDYGQAATDLQKLISLLEMSSDDNCTSGTLPRSSSNTSDLNQARIRLYTAEEEARNGASLDMYLILGVERSCSAADVRKAYRKAALRHHPDKAGHFLVRSENSDARIWGEIAEEVHMNADRLFKMIGEAYTTLVDPTKRLQYDTEVDTKTKNSSSRTSASSHSSQFERSGDPRHWRSYGNSHRRWPENSWSTR